MLGRFCSCKIDIHAIHGARKGFDSMDAIIEPTWTYLRRPLTGTPARNLTSKGYIQPDPNVLICFGHGPRAGLQTVRLAKQGRFRIYPS